MKVLKKMVNFILRHYKESLVAILAIIILLVFVYFASLTNKKINELKIEDASLYQYTGDQKFEINATITINEETDETIMSIDGEEITIDSTPFYYQGERKVLLPTEMSVIFPLSNIAQRKINHYSIIDGTSTGYYIKNSSLNYLIETAFLFDGNDLYFFVSEVTIVIGDENIILSPMSYVTLNYNNELYAYDYESDIMVYISDVNDNVYAICDDFTINLSIDAVIYGDNSRLLIKEFKYLNLLS